MDNRIDAEGRLDLQIRETKAQVDEVRVRLMDLKEQLRQLTMFLEVFEARRNAFLSDQKAASKRSERARSKGL